VSQGKRIPLSLVFPAFLVFFEGIFAKIRKIQSFGYFTFSFNCTKRSNDRVEKLKNHIAITVKNGIS
jgi:hypothetical protein